VSRRRRYSAAELVREELFDLARAALKDEEWCYSPACFSGADRAEAPLYACVRRFYERVAGGEDSRAVFASEDARWRAYAAENNAKVEAAPRIRRGPMSGASSIHYRHTSPEMFEQKRPHLFAMVAKITGAP